MMKNSLIYFVLLFNLIQLSLVKITHQASPGFLHTATLINKKLYILSIYDYDSLKNGTGGGNQFFHIDVSTPFNTLTLRSNSDYVDPSLVGATAVNGGRNGNTLFVYGKSAGNNNSIYTYDTKSNTWNNNQIITGLAPENVTGLTAIVDNNEKIYLFGGESFSDQTVENTMFNLDSINLNWGSASSAPWVPAPKFDYGACLLPNQNIIYMGGRDHTDLSLPLDIVYIYDTNKDIWSEQSTQNAPPSSRFGLSVVVGLNGKQLILFGGTGADVTSDKALYTLDLKTFEWQIPQVSGNIPASRYNHKANVIGNYMVVTYGFGYDQSENDILLLDISNKNEFKWTTEFVPPKESGLSRNALIGVIVGSSVGGILLISIGLFFLFRWNRNKKVQIDGTHDKQSGKGGMIVQEAKQV